MGEEMSRKPYIREVPKTSWFFRQPRYMRYMAREVTSFFIGAYTLLLVVALKRLAQGPDAFLDFLNALHSPLGVLFNLAALVAAVYHSTSWFNVTPQAMPIQRGEEFVPGHIIVGAHYAVWAVVSLVVLIWGV
ncbi:MAG TPA: fumarate reductase subunit C [Candidatus Competibacter sp.]|nr:fumarate reductase subunit C [Candidatus Competibacter sp.]MCC9002644.1 fumarate reductase subunit C [Candidatus Competibacter sp.]HRX59928.1 fumarate reductase subunit C [Candidatus Competibacter sp.]HUM89762.1 fumarate reductase subunit C [Candidatus Competibacter sp.]